MCVKANLVIQEGRLTVANAELAKAQSQLDEKQAELDKVQAKFDAAMKEKQVSTILLYFPLSMVYSAKCHHFFLEQLFCDSDSRNILGV